MEGSDHCRRDEVSDWVKLVNVSGDGLMVMTAIDDGGNESLCAAAATVRQEPSKFESVRPRVSESPVSTRIACICRTLQNVASRREFQPMLAIVNRLVRAQGV